MEPESGTSSPASSRNSVLLPVPFGATMPTRVPAATVSDTSSSTTRGPYDFDTARATRVADTDRDTAEPRGRRARGRVQGGGGAGRYITRQANERLAREDGNRISTRVPPWRVLEIFTSSVTSCINRSPRFRCGFGTSGRHIRSPER